MSSQNISIPLRLLQDAEGHLVQAELDDGTTIRGYVLNVEDTMNCKFKEAVIISKSGQRTAVKETFVRGSRIVFFTLPAVMERAPILNRGDAR